VDLHFARLSGLDLSYMDLSHLILWGADLSNTNLRCANLREADLRGANLSGNDLRSADLGGCDLRWVNFSHSILRDKNFVRANLLGVNFARADLVGVSMTDAQLGRANLSGAQLYGADLRGADLSDADLTDVDLSNVRFAGIRIFGTNLSGVNFGDLEDDLWNGYWNDRLEGIDFTQTRLFSRAVLRGVKLEGLQMTRADFSYADLTDAKLTGAVLFQANLKGAILDGAHAEQVFFREADLSEASLKGSVLASADFRNADLSRADLRRSILCSAALQYAILDKVNLTGAWLWETLRAGWSIKGITCSEAYLGPDENHYYRQTEPSPFSPGEFERLYAEQPIIELLYEGGIRFFELNTLPALLDHLSTSHPSVVIRLKSLQDAAKGTKVVIQLEEVDAHTVNRIRAEAEELHAIQVSLRDESNESARSHIETRIRNMLREEFALMRKQLGPNLHIGGSVSHAVIQIAGHRGSNSAVMAGNRALETQSLLSELRARTEEIPGNPEEKHQIEAALEPIEQELKKVEPQPSIICRGLGAVSEIAMKLAANVTEKVVVGHWESLLHSLSNIASQWSQ
jgi:uncharacterized protein YjbI with pentapeptide repeats